MRPDGVVVPSPLFNHDLGLFQSVEDLAVEKFIAQLRVEAFTVSILPRAARHDVSRLRSHGCKPFAKGLCDELRPVV